MQENNKKASILLWAVMLSLIVAITFISISSKINKNIKSSWQFSQFNNEINNTNLLIQNWISQNIDSRKTIVFENNKERIFSLKKWEIKNLSFSWTNPYDINIWIINWWALNYNYIFDWIVTSSGIINSSENFSDQIDNTTKTGSLNFENFWWYTSFLIKSENEFEESNKKYKIVTKIGNNFLNETKWTLK